MQGRRRTRRPFCSVAMVLLGITGGIGMGKSTAGALLQQRAIPVLDTDLVARQQTSPGSPALDEIREVFGSAVFHPDGSLSRAALGQVVFADATARIRLEAILHPRIAQAWRDEVTRWRTSGEQVGAVLIPLLFEREYDAEFTACVAVACSASTQRQRLRQRGWEDAEIDVRNRAQLAVVDKMARARFVVWTEGSLEVHSRQWDRVLDSVRIAPVA